MLNKQFPFTLPSDKTLSLKIEEEKRKRTVVYGKWVKKIVSKTEWERYYQFLDYFLLTNTREGKPVIAYRIGYRPGQLLPLNCEPLSDDEYMTLVARYKDKIK